ncbi:MAG: hypothetical protein IJY58_04510 [Alphaproteobacteria bacterium]|nr:hypothetical protein [Alphaproteobacteria bacterium]
MSCLNVAGRGCLTTLFVMAGLVGAGTVMSGLKSCGKSTGNIVTDVVEVSKDATEAVSDWRDFEDVKTPTGKFKIDFVSRFGPNKRFEFVVQGRDKDGQVKMKMRELGGEDTSLGGMARFNVIFWEAAYPEKKGLAFQLCLNESSGAFVRSYDASLPTLIITDGERVTGHRQENANVTFDMQIPDLRRSKSRGRKELSLPDKQVDIPQKVIDEHDINGVPLVVPKKVQRSYQHERTYF